MNPKLKKRFISSIDFLRKMDFFKNYSNLTSEEIFDKILNGEIDYAVNWEDRLWDTPQGVLLKERIEEHKERYMKKKITEIDYELACFDTKRVLVQIWDIVIEEGIGMGLVKKLGRISRGFFQPTDVVEKMSEWKGEAPPALDLPPSLKPEEKWGYRFEVHFKFKGEERVIEIYTFHSFLNLDSATKKINKWIEDTGYQYYSFYPDHINYVLLSREEEKRMDTLYSK
jgi:hypothetical protein